MKRSIKTILALFLTIAMLAAFFVTGFATGDIKGDVNPDKPEIAGGIPSLPGHGNNTNQPEDGDMITFGTYPQTRVTDADLLAEFDALDIAWTSYDYYSGKESNSPEDISPDNFMRFADFFCGGEKYRAVKFSQYRPNYTQYPSDNKDRSYQDENGYEPNTVYYFRYEPLTWRVLDRSAGFIMCENAVDAQAYHNTFWYNDGMYYQAEGSSVPANDYAASSICAWLNHDFYETAFTAGQKEKMNGNPAAADKKVFLLSMEEALDNAYGFSSDMSAPDAARYTKGTDYAKCQGLLVNANYNPGYSGWVLRSPSTNSRRTWSVLYSGRVDGFHEVNFTGSGIRPACILSDIASDDSRSESLFSEIKGSCVNHSYGELIPEVPATCTRDGVIAHYKCSACGELFDHDKNPVDVLTIPTPGHDWSEDDRTAEKPAGCLTDGNIGYYTCTRCGGHFDTDGNLLTDNDIVIPAIGRHETELTGMKEATATEDGYTGDEVCKTCGDTIKTGEIIPAFGEPEEQEQNDSFCKWCGKSHTGFFGKVVGSFHSVIYFFAHLFGRK